jgi:tRNA threonylcarbamoyladenosine biosynthesis protein TsaE
MSILQDDTLEVTSHNREQTAQIGAVLGQLLRGDDVVCLSGDLGAGKTAFTSGVAEGWGAKEPVNSPTFVFVHEHTRPTDSMRLYHLDCYRIASEDDAISIGLEDILAGQDVVVIEWPEQVESFLPEARLWVELEAPNLDGDPTRRQITFKATGSRYKSLLQSLIRRTI